MRRLALFSVALTMLATSAAAQTRDGEALQRLLAVYRQDARRGVDQLIAATQPEIDRYLQACQGTEARRAQTPPRGNDPGSGPAACSRHDFLTFSLLFQDAAIELIDRDYNRSGRFLGHGEYLLEALYRDYPDHTPLEIRFISLWYAHSIRFLLTQRYLQRAVTMIEHVTPWFAASAEIDVARGMIAEIPVGWLSSNLRGKEPTVIDDNALPITFYLPRSGPRTPYAAASNQYLQALTLEPNHVGAWLRLAWVRVRMRDDRAVQDAQRALTLAGDDEERYLAQLLLAAAADVRADASAAIDAYTRAREVAPQYQSACTGLASAYTSAGKADDAARVALECLRIEDDEAHPDPWLTLRVGLTEPAIVNWLDAEARRP